MDAELFTPQDWINRARSNLIIVKSFNLDNLPEELYIEDLCFELQQCAEKAVKAVLVYFEQNFSKTHDIAYLLKLVKEKTTADIPENVNYAKQLTKYATKTRYPAWNKISVEELKESLQIAQDIYNWSKKIIEDEIILLDK